MTWLAMKYQGKLYGKVGRKTFDTGKTSDDWDRMESFVKSCRDDFDCDADAHRYGTMCRSCAARDALLSNNSAEPRPKGVGSG